MNYTENYHLPQWEETDRIMRTDFNAAMASLEGGLTECRDAAAAGSVWPTTTGTPRRRWRVSPRRPGCSGRGSLREKEERRPI